MSFRVPNTLDTLAVNGPVTGCNIAVMAARLLLLIISVGMVTSCKHPLEIIGQGDITSASGLRNCSLVDFQAGEDNCTMNEVTGAYNETYTAWPADGWTFRGWKTYCDYTNVDNTCSFNYSAAQVSLYESVPPLRAEFIEDCPEGETCTESLTPLLGAVTDSSIKIWQATRGVTSFVVRYKTGTDLWSSSAPTTIDASTGWVATVPLTGLEPNTVYEYETWLNSVLDRTGTFSTLPLSSSMAPLHFGFGTDFHHFYHPFTALGTASEKGFDFMLLAGDLMYADHPPTVANTVDGYSDRYWLTWNDPGFSALAMSTPLFMTWDDHEIIDDYYAGMVAAGETSDRYPAARAAYDAYVHSHNPDTLPDTAPPPGGTSGNVLYYSFSAPGADFFVLDTRSYRSPNNPLDYPGKTMLGTVQREALLAFLGQSTAAFKFIVTTVPFALGEDSGDTWSNYQTERDLILSGIDGIPGVLFLSGDRHWSGAFRFISSGGYAYYDFLPSPTGAFLRPEAAPQANANPNETVIYTAGTYQALGDFQIDFPGGIPTLRTAFVDENGNDRCVITIRSDETGVIPTEPVAACELGPPVLSISNILPRQITLAWNDVLAETGYSLLRSSSDSTVVNAAGEIVLLDPVVIPLGMNATAYTDINLTPNTTYYYQLVAVNDTAESASSVVSAKTLMVASCN
jgi:hypothetical protein